MFAYLHTLDTVCLRTQVTYWCVLSVCLQVSSECRERGALMGMLWSQVKGVLELRAGLEAESRLGAMQVYVCVCVHVRVCVCVYVRVCLCAHNPVCLLLPHVH